MGTKTIKRAYVSSDAAIEEIASWAPEGWGIHRATMTEVENGDRGVRVWFQNDPIAAPEVRIKPEAAPMFPQAVTGVRYLQGEASVEISYEDGTTATVPSSMVSNMVDVIPERRPKIRLLTPSQIQDHESLDLLMRAKAVEGSAPKSRIMLDVLIPDDKIRELFDLGADVSIDGVRGSWQGEPIAGRGVFQGFSIRCSAPA